LPEAHLDPAPRFLVKGVRWWMGICDVTCHPRALGVYVAGLPEDPKLVGRGCVADDVGGAAVVVGRGRLCVAGASWWGGSGQLGEELPGEQDGAECGER
jgi:hypothetical protein